MIAGDVARAGALVRVPPERAFALFTADIDQWWRRGPAYRVRERSVLSIEPFVGGRLFESFETTAGTRVLPTGEVLVWEPPVRLVLRWRAVNFRADEATEVEVHFDPRPSGTWVSVEHRGWSDIRPDHPVRHGQPVPAFVAELGRWWGGLLTSLAVRAASP
jgi:uncharacterized protein YndB with AHSA1/START domain